MRLSKCSRTVRRTYTAAAASDVGGMPSLAWTALWKPASVAHTGSLPEMADMRARSAAIHAGRGDAPPAYGWMLPRSSQALWSPTLAGPLGAASDGPMTGRPRSDGCALTLRYSSRL